MSNFYLFSLKISDLFIKWDWFWFEIKDKFGIALMDLILHDQKVNAMNSAKTGLVFRIATKGGGGIWTGVSSQY